MNKAARNLEKEIDKIKDQGHGHLISLDQIESMDRTLDNARKKHIPNILNTLKRLDDVAAPMRDEMAQSPIITVNGRNINATTVAGYLGHLRVSRNVDLNHEFFLNFYKSSFPKYYKIINAYSRVYEKSIQLKNVLYNSPEPPNIEQHTIDMLKALNRIIELNDLSVTKLAGEMEYDFITSLKNSKWADTALQLHKIPQTRFIDFTLDATQLVADTVSKRYPGIPKLYRVDTNSPEKSDTTVASYLPSSNIIEYTDVYFSMPRNLPIFADTVIHELTHYLQNYNLGTLPKTALAIRAKHHKLYNKITRYENRFSEHEAFDVAGKASENMDMKYITHESQVQQ